MFKINKSAILIGFSLILILILTCGCNSREDVKHTSKKDIIKYVNKVIDEPVEYVSKQGEEDK